MSEEIPRLWLNWEAFEIVAVGSLFPSDISIDKIHQFASHFSDLTAFLPQSKWVEAASQVFRLSQDYLCAIYSCLVCFLTSDPEVSLLQTQIILSGQEICSPYCVRVIDMLCYLYAIYVKKKFRNLSETSQFEQFPSKVEEARLSPRQRVFSSSTPTVNTRFSIQTPKADHSVYQLMVRFFISHLPEFLAIFSPDGLSELHIASLSFLIHCGPNYARRVSLTQLFGLFSKGSVEPISRIVAIVHQHLPISKEADMFIRNEPCSSSPLIYRPLLHRSLSEASPSESKDFPIDRPLLFSDLSNTQIFESLSSAPDVHIHNCRHVIFYLCGSASAVFVSHCKDSTVFVGSCSAALHLEFCSNVIVIAATRMIHIDSSSATKAFLLSNVKPLITGISSRTVLAPYNALYAKFGIDTLSSGINPLLNLWNEPLILGTLSRSPSSLFELAPPADFELFTVPFAWAHHQPVLSCPIPSEYSAALDAKKRTIMSVKENLDKIRAKDAELADKIVYQIRGRASKWIQEEGHMQEITWLYGVAETNATQ